MSHWSFHNNRFFINDSGDEPSHSSFSILKAIPRCYEFGDVRLQLHGAIYRPDSFVLMLRYCANLKAIRYESTSLKRIVADKSRV